MPAIAIKNLSKKFGRIQALNDVSFDVPRHSIFGLLGPNGAGKTTFFSLIAGFLKPTTGTIEVLGIDNRKISQLQGRLTIFPQDAQFQHNVPILDQLVFFRLLDGGNKTKAHQEVLQTLELVGLQDMAKRRIGSLSHGMIKRLGIAQAFLGQPEVILLDEPTAGLDPANARQIRDLVKKLQAQATIVVSSHNLDEIQELCDHVAILDHGKLIMSGPVKDVTRANRKYNFTLSRALLDNETISLSALTGIQTIESANDSSSQPKYLITLDLTDNSLSEDTVLSNFLRHLLDREITPRNITEGRSLETHFLELTGKTSSSFLS